MHVGGKLIFFKAVVPDGVNMLPWKDTHPRVYEQY